MLRSALRRIGSVGIRKLHFNGFREHVHVAEGDKFVVVCGYRAANRKNVHGTCVEIPFVDDGAFPATIRF